jgi:hypothetical protein
MDLGPGRAPLAETEWLKPYPDSMLGSTQVGSEARYEAHEGIELAFVAVLQTLPGRAARCAGAARRPRLLSAPGGRLPGYHGRVGQQCPAARARRSSAVCRKRANAVRGSTTWRAQAGGAVRDRVGDR